VKINLEHNGQPFSVELTPVGRSYRVNLGEETLEAQVLQAKDGVLDLLIDGNRLTVHVSSDNTRRWVTVNGRTLIFQKSAGGRTGRGGLHHAAGELTAPMPGQVRAVNVKEGETVTKGQTLLLLEAMKMEIRVQSPRDGVVKRLSVQQGQTVEREQLLAEIEEP
jgi:3-methylcrotonyl-CoA carboxylase alpha subunit